MEVFIPKTLEELLPVIDNQNRRITAGCTDIIVALRNNKMQQKPAINITNIHEIKKIYEKDNRIYIGSNVTLSEIIDNSLIKDNFKVLADALETIGSPQIRNRATLGGNIQNASPSGDGILALTLLGAFLILKSATGCREIKLEEFISGVGETELGNDEFIEYIILDKKYSGYKAYFEKVGLRSAMVISIASMGLIYKLDEDVIVDVKVVFGAVAPKVIRIKEAEEYLKGKKIEEKYLEQAGEIIGNKVSPIDDLRASAEYRRAVCKNLILRLMEL